MGIDGHVSHIVVVHTPVAAHPSTGERQRSDFIRIYEYAVASILFMHFAINVGMVLDRSGHRNSVALYQRRWLVLGRIYLIDFRPVTVGCRAFHDSSLIDTYTYLIEKLPV